ncbi:MAG: hypothetical protein WBB82_09525, partial [Limnothrix sp.]
MTLFDSLDRTKVAIARNLNKIPLRVTMTLPFLLQTCAVVGIVGFLSYRTGQKSIRDVVGQLHNELAGRVEQKLQTYLDLPHRINELTASAVERGDFQLNFAGDTQAQTRLLAQYLQTFPEMTWVY